MFFKAKTLGGGRINTAFNEPGVYFVAAPNAETAEKQIRTYGRTLGQTEIGHNFGYISSNSALVPYLNVKANLFIQGREHDLDILPRFMLDDPLFLGQNSRALTPVGRLYVEFYRNVLGGKRYIVIADLLHAMTRATVNKLLTDFGETAQHLGISVLLFTSDDTLIRDHPGRAFAAAPELLETDQAG
ncbi:hypothetical protein [Lacticaseibacillus songhuajiangensis]|jgi:hypothetical protein|uniref:hypothetical protein n=1 Tax=Lacticaseibacillus songhuajiangensis TaxID=1296539 RepID=UPI000F7961FA|nr:hypothetical protein [Lacticaseibacillus songhuajiangensis]